MSTYLCSRGFNLSAAFEKRCPQARHFSFVFSFFQHLHIHPLWRAGLPIMRAWSGMSLVTTAPAPMKA